MRRKFLITILAMLGLVLLASGLGWYLLNDEAFLKRQLHDLALDHTGRSLDFGGKLELQPGATTVIEADKVTFANAPWAVEPYMAEAGHVVLSFDLRSLFGDQAVVHEVQLADCKVAVSENDQGDSNWKLSGRKKIKKKPAGLPWLRIEQLSVKNCQLSLDKPERAQALHVDVPDMELKRQQNGNYEVQARGQVEGVPLDLTGELGPMRSLWLGGPFDEQVKLAVGKISLVSSGSFDDVRTGSGANVSMQFSGPEFAVVTDYLAWPPFSSDAFDFNLQFKTEGAMTAVNIDGDLGSFDISASGELDRILKPGNGRVSLSARGPDLQALGELFDIDGLVKDAFEISLETTIVNEKVRLTPLNLSTASDEIELRGTLGPWPGLQGSDIDFKAHADEFGRWAGLLGREVFEGGEFSVSGNVSADASGMVSTKADFEYQQSSLSIDGTLGTLPRPENQDIRFSFHSPDLSRLDSLLGKKDLPQAESRADGRFSRGEQGFALNKTVIYLAENHVEVNANITTEANRAGSTVQLQVDVPSTATLGRIFGRDDLPDQPLRLSVLGQPAGKGMDIEVEDGHLGDIRLSFKGRIPDIRSPRIFSARANITLPSMKLLSLLLPDTNWPPVPLTFSGNVGHQSDRLKITSAHLVLGKSSADVSGMIGLGGNYGGSTLKFSGGGPDLSELFPEWDWHSLPKKYSLSGSWARGPLEHELENMQFTWGDSSLDFHGSAGSLWPPDNLQLRFDAHLADASILNDLLKWKIEAQALSMSSGLSGSFTDLSLNDMSARFGASDFKGNLELELGDPRKLSGAVHFGNLDLTHWMEQRRIRDAQASAGADGKTGAEQTPVGNRLVFRDQEVKEMATNILALDLDVRADKVRLQNAELRDVHLGILHSGHVFRLNPLEGSDISGSRLEGNFDLDASGPLPLLSTDLHGHDLRFGLAAVKGQDPATYPPTEVDLKLRGKGSTYHEIASSLNGDIKIFAGSGQVSAAGVELLYSDFLVKLFNALDPFAKRNKYTEFACGIAVAQVTDGVVSVNPIVLQTSEVLVLSQGKIDLSTERIDLTFNSHPRRGLGLSAGTLVNPFIKIGGTLAAPAMELDPAGAVIKGGTAVATVGISLLAKSLSDRFLSKDPCVEARKEIQAREEPAQ